jgi:hypothetical protein
LDRERRVRLALWIYASISVSQLRSTANFWATLPKELKAFNKGLPKKFQESFEAFSNSLHMTLKTELDPKKAFLKRLLSDPQSQGLPEAFNSSSQREQDIALWQNMMLNTKQGIKQIHALSSGCSTSLEQRISQYELDEAERLFLPKSEVEFEVATTNFFGAILDLAKLSIGPQFTLTIINSEIFLTPVSLAQNLLLMFQDRLYGTRASDDMKCLICRGETYIQKRVDEVRLTRWRELASIMSEGIFLLGNNDRDRRRFSHPFLDIQHVANSGTDYQFSRLKEILRRKGSWLRDVCTQLNGLAQALKQIADPFHDHRKVRAFHIILRRKVQDTFRQQRTSCNLSGLYSQNTGEVPILATIKRIVLFSVKDVTGWHNIFLVEFIRALEDVSEQIRSTRCHYDTNYDIAAGFTSCLMAVGRTFTGRLKALLKSLDSCGALEADFACDEALKTMVTNMEQVILSFEGWIRGQRKMVEVHEAIRKMFKGEKAGL